MAILEKLTENRRIYRLVMSKSALDWINRHVLYLLKTHIVYRLHEWIILIIKKQQLCGMLVVDHKLGSLGLMVIYLIPNSWAPPGLC